MASLNLTLDDEEHELPDDTAHYLWAEGDRLYVTAQCPPSWATGQLGYFSPMFGNWWFHLDPPPPRTLWLDGQPVIAARHQLPRSRAQVSLREEKADVQRLREPYQPPAQKRGAGWVI